MTILAFVWGKSYAEWVKKLLLFATLLVLVLLLSWWAKGANFSLATMIRFVTNPQPTATSSAQPQQKIDGSLAPTAIPIEILITVTPNGFVPDALMIAPNTKITWVNKTPSTANISSDPLNAFPGLNLGDFGDNESVSLIFIKDGRYHYDNGKNPSQKGTIIVK